jgi:hypothetical protein
MIARLYGSKLTTLHVLLPSVSEYMAPDMSATLLDDTEDAAKSEMERVDAQLKGLPRETIIERGVGVWPVLSPDNHSGAYNRAGRAEWCSQRRTVPLRSFCYRFQRRIQRGRAIGRITWTYANASYTG